MAKTSFSEPSHLQQFRIVVGRARRPTTAPDYFSKATLLSPKRGAIIQLFDVARRLHSAMALGMRQLRGHHHDQSGRIDQRCHFCLIEQNYPRIDLVPRDLPGVSPSKNRLRADAEPVGNGLGLAEPAHRHTVERSILWSA
ncbi:MAG: hypothetical protein PHE83_05405 [Opitutaceae bacterium]|nr:hypothetical protein [Opitutaceae bacterium]